MCPPQHQCSHSTLEMRLRIVKLLLVHPRWNLITRKVNHHCLQLSHQSNIPPFCTLWNMILVLPDKPPCAQKEIMTSLPPEGPHHSEGLTLLLTKPSTDVLFGRHGIWPTSMWYAEGTMWRMYVISSISCILYWPSFHRNGLWPTSKGSAEGTVRQRYTISRMSNVLPWSTLCRNAISVYCKRVSTYTKWSSNQFTISRSSWHRW